MNKYIRKIIEKNKGRRFWDETWGEKKEMGSFDSGIYKETRERGKLGTVIDLGALEGEFSLYIYDLADKIFAVEPQPEAFKVLKENCQNLPKIRPFQYIISNLNGYKYIQGNDDGGAHTTDEGSADDPTKSRVVSKTLATFMKENKIGKVDVLKIDVESHEPYIFGSEDFKEVAHKIKFIIGEHGSGLEDLLRPLGFEYKEGFTAWRE